MNECVDLILGYVACWSLWMKFFERNECAENATKWTKTVIIEFNGRERGLVVVNGASIQHIKCIRTHLHLYTFIHVCMCVCTVNQFNSHNIKTWENARERPQAHEFRNAGCCGGWYRSCKRSNERINVVLYQRKYIFN